MQRRLSRLVRSKRLSHSSPVPPPAPTPPEVPYSFKPMSTPASEYPRPDFQRVALHWESLNGPWDFLFDDDDVGFNPLGWHQTGLPTHAASENGKPHAKRTIQVPFVFQCPASGIHERGDHQVLWYERQIEDLRSPEERSVGHRLLIRFGAVDYNANVWLNGQVVGQHRGGHVPFDLDLTEATRFANGSTHRLTVRVFDSAFDRAQPRGKQFWEPRSKDIWYCPSSGIWQNVWLESVPPIRIADSSRGTILRSHDIQGGLLDCRIAVLGRRVSQNVAVELEASFAGVTVSNSGRRELFPDKEFVRFDVGMRLTDEQLQRLQPQNLSFAPLDDDTCWRGGLALWSPEHPLLYDVTIRLFDAEGQLLDEVRVTTGMRSLNWTSGDGTFRLNGHPYFQALFLDQGYWPESLMTPPNHNACRRDIELAKAMGMNGCRKHQKVEDPLFMYWADRLGFLVWGEMASAHDFSQDYVESYNQEWMEMVKRDINHPSVVTWTLANESWGYPDLGGSIEQRNHLRTLYHMTKTIDPARPINDNCGWEHVITDLTTFHEYGGSEGMADRCRSLKDIVGRGRPMFLQPIYGPKGIVDEGSRHVTGAPVMCTEFGGVNVRGGDDTGEGNWGYTTASDSQDLVNRVRDIVLATVRDGLVCALVWTQFTDVEQEKNGLYTYDRREKLPAREMRAIMDEAARIYFTKRYHV